MKFVRFTCDICGGKFSRYSSLWSHKTLHTGIKKFSCNICNASFAKANYLNNHKRVSILQFLTRLLIPTFHYYSTFSPLSRPIQERSPIGECASDLLICRQLKSIIIPDVQHAVSPLLNRHT